MNTTLKLNEKNEQQQEQEQQQQQEEQQEEQDSDYNDIESNLPQEEVTKFNGFVSRPGFGCRTEKCPNREATYGDIFLPFCSDVDSCMKKNLEYLILENVRQKGVIEALSNVMTINDYDFDTKMDISDDELDEDTNMDISQEIQQTL